MEIINPETIDNNKSHFGESRVRSEAFSAIQEFTGSPIKSGMTQVDLFTYRYNHIGWPDNSLCLFASRINPRARRLNIEATGTVDARKIPSPKYGVYGMVKRKEWWWSP